MSTVQPLETALVRPIDWTSALPALLRQVGVEDLLVPLDLDLESYGTARMMARDAEEVREVVGKFASPTCGNSDIVLVERLPPGAAAELAEAGLSLQSVDASTVLAEIDVLSQAWRHTHAVWPELSSSVEYLVRCVHLLKAPSPEVDCSFSRPDLPFSVFLSIPDSGSRARVERVAEALVHETMHLQLSLLERRIQLVEPDRPESVTFSPWRNCERNVQGVLHALYVFVIVQRLWQLAAHLAPRGLDLGFAKARVRAVRDEIAAAQRLRSSLGITREGRQLVRQLLEWGRSPLDDSLEVVH